jgi:ankyrin repeat protein
MTLADSSGATALGVAVSREHEGVVKSLLDHHANVDATDHSGQTPLMVATQSGFEGMVELLQQKNP